jgi:hypothetical protein
MPNKDPILFRMGSYLHICFDLLNFLPIGGIVGAYSSPIFTLPFCLAITSSAMLLGAGE